MTRMSVGLPLTPLLLVRRQSFLSDLVKRTLRPAAFDGATPLDIARTKGNQQAVQLLTSMGGVCKTAC